MLDALAFTPVILLIVLFLEVAFWVFAWTSLRGLFQQLRERIK